MEIKILQVFYDNNGLPYKDKERSVHYPITPSPFMGASNTTQIRFYYDQLDELDESTFVAVSKLPNGKNGSEILEKSYDSQLEENYVSLNLSSFYTQYKGDVYISLQGYQGGVRVEQDENGIYQIYGTPTIAATGSICLGIKYAPQFVGSGQTENVTLQRVLAELATKLGIRQETLHVEELPTVGNPNVWYVINDDPNDATKANIYIWNTKTQTYVWVGDNTLNLGNYYTKEQGEQFEEEIEDRVSGVEDEVASISNGAPSGVYATVSALTSDDPDHSKVYLVLADGKWYYWDSANNQWSAGGVYLSTGNAITHSGNQLKDDQGNNLFPNRYVGSLSNVNLATATIEQGNYTIAPNSNVTGLPSDFSGEYYAWLFVIYGTFYIMVETSSNRKSWFCFNKTQWVSFDLNNLVKCSGQQLKDYNGNNFCPQLFVSQVSNIDIRYNTWTCGLYAFSPGENITGLPNDFDITSYGWLFVLNDNLRLLFNNSTKDMWVSLGKTGYVKFLLNKDLVSGVQQILDLIYSGIKNGAYSYIAQETTQTLHENYLLTSSGIVAYTSPDSYNVIEVDVNAGDIVLINSKANYSNAFYRIANANDSTLAYKSTGGSGGTVLSYNSLLVMPANATKLYVAYIGVGQGLATKIELSYSEGKKWLDKKWACLGDSLTENNIRTTLHYHDYIAEKTGITVVNLGVSGTGYMRHQEDNRAFYQRVSDIPLDADVITIFGSGNDLGGGYTLGSPTDVGTTTICGCINQTLDNILDRFLQNGKVPTIGVITPTPWVNNPPSNPTGSMSLYCDAIIQCCKRKSIPVLDLFRESNLHPDNATFRTLAYSKDEGNGVHPDETGHKIIAPMFEAFLYKLLLS